MASTSLSNTQEVFKLGGELHRIRARRFTLVREVNDRILRGCSDYAEDHGDWFRRADAALSALRDDGQADLADDLARKWLSRNIVTDPGNFKLQVPTGHGYERWEITASDRLQEDSIHRSDASYVPKKAGGAANPAVEVIPCGSDEAEDELGALPAGGAPPGPTQLPSRLLALAEPITLRLSEADVARWPTMTLDQARRYKMWLNSTKSGTVFCLVCDCPAMTLPAQRLDSSAPYGLMPRHFHRDPFERDVALVHFLKVHREGYSEGVKEMLVKWARRVKMSSEEQLSMDKWAIASHNLSAQAWYQQLFSTWRQLQERYRPQRGGRKKRACTVETGRVLSAGLVSSEAHVFQWPKPGDETWVVLCSYPNCEHPDFKNHPLLRDRALEHFRTHGVHLASEHEVLQNFGFRVPDYMIKQETTNEEGGMGQERSMSREPVSRPGLISQRAEYHKFSYGSLRRECRLRGIPLADTQHSKAALEKKLKINDGLEDYDDKSAWPARRLRAECLRRGLRITRSQTKSVIPRPILIKMLERHDTQLRQRAASGNVLSGDNAEDASADASASTVATPAEEDEIARQQRSPSANASAVSRMPIRQSPRSTRARISRTSTPTQRRRPAARRSARASSVAGFYMDPGSEDELDPLQSILEEDE